MSKYVNVKRCSACSKDHGELPVVKMKKSLHDQGEIYTHYVLCPDTGRTILVRKEDIYDRVEE